MAPLEQGARVVPWGAWEAPQVPNCKETKKRLGAEFHRPFGT